MIAAALSPIMIMGRLETFLQFSFLIPADESYALRPLAAIKRRTKSATAALALIVLLPDTAR
jgi:hypothetical protein